MPRPLRRGFLFIDNWSDIRKILGMKEIAKYSGCFVCGAHNHIGLKAKFFFENNQAVTEYTAEKRFEGYKNIFHGGIIATLLDEVMIKALLSMDIYSMTVELNIRFHKIVNIGDKLSFTGRLEKKRGRLYLTNGEAKNESGETVASAEGKYLEVKNDMKGMLLESLDDD
jgi:acyl-coenzyme A thioesterase PaaI-like protein